MSVTTNVIAKFKQLFYNSGTTPDLVDTAVEAMNDYFYTVKLPNGADGNSAVTAANSAVTIPVFVDSKLIAAKLSCDKDKAILNTAADDIVVTIATNGVTVSTFNSNAAATGAVAANATVNLTVNTVNSFVDAGENILVAYTMADNTNNTPNAIISLQLRRQ
jgi:hypothetical protein